MARKIELKEVCPLSLAVIRRAAKLRLAGPAPIPIRSISISYGVLTDKDAKRILVQSTGVAEPSSDGTLPLAENIYMHGNHQAYEWMNTKQFWANGLVDPKDMSLRVYVFAA
jgi:hypothetical protein